ncbi:hypothetical protein BDN70DRAFT_550211 [Pholiota conissans]|uniref:F-box domain-containing protein n=1 Tax=Pholiota conissans TaxID=109636 RepID=A0A9P5Z8G8_9AGAR|nr:hypothetical protein BDN70DRAFT_550211 [Pholiota conissans]
MLDARYDISHLQAEEVFLAAALSSVRSKLNELQPMSQLPPEILEEIFRICVSWLYDYQKPKHPLAWTQVCSLWRQVSINSSRLWQRIDLCDSRFADEFLVRSKEAPLSVVSASPLKATTDSLTLHASRLRSIDLFLLADDMAHLFARLGPLLPALTRLSLKVPHQPSALDIDLAVPLVRHLVLDSITVKWNSCQDLVHLSLRGLDPECCPSITELHDMFASSPCLEYVRLENMNPRNLHTDSARSINLIHLKDMIISAPSSVVTALLSGLYIGPHARLQLYTSLNQGLYTIFPHGLPYLASCGRPDIGTVRLSRHSAHLICSGAPPWSELSSKTLLSISSATPLINGICTSLDRLFSLSCVTKLELNSGALFDIPLKVLQSFFAGLSNLETLLVAFNDLEALLGVLKSVRVTKETPMCLPCLRTLSFGKASVVWHLFEERWLALVMECVRTRHFHSSSLQTLEFIRCSGVSSISTAHLKPFVDEIIIHPDRRSQNYF